MSEVQLREALRPGLKSVVSVKFDVSVYEEGEKNRTSTNALYTTSITTVLDYAGAGLQNVLNSASKSDVILLAGKVRRAYKSGGKGTADALAQSMHQKTIDVTKVLAQKVVDRLPTTAEEALVQLSALSDVEFAKLVAQKQAAEKHAAANKSVA